LAPFYAALVPAVRGADESHPVLYQDWATSEFGYPAQLGQAPNPPWGFPRNVRAYGVECGTPLRSSPCRTQRAEAMRRARRAARDDGGTSLITRFGERGDVADAREVVELADRYGEGWFFDAYKAYGDAGARPLYSDRGRAFVSRVRTVAAPYPKRIAGRDATWAFDRADRHFTLRYRGPRSPTGRGSARAARGRDAAPAGAGGSADCAVDGDGPIGGSGLAGSSVQECSAIVSVARSGVGLAGEGGVVPWCHGLGRLFSPTQPRLRRGCVVLSLTYVVNATRSPRREGVCGAVQVERTIAPGSSLTAAVRRTRVHGSTGKRQA
jgi:hypothetical protein